MLDAKSLFGTGEFKFIKRLAQRETKTVVEVVTEERTQEFDNIKLGHRSSAKRVFTAQNLDRQNVREKWLPRIEVNGQLVFIKDEKAPEGVASFETRYLALNFARRFLAQIHKKNI
jgi:DNA polymerase III sliding clamp (beta) subunit (PCNA family)